MATRRTQRKVVIEERTWKDGSTRFDARWYCADASLCESALLAGRTFCRGHKKGTCGFTTRAEAEAAGYAAQAAARAAALGFDPTLDRRVTLGEVATMWFGSGPPGIGARTMRGYGERWRTWCNHNPAIPLVPAASVTRAKVIEWMQELRHRGLASSTMRQDLIVLRHILGHATDLGLTPTNPAVGVTPPGSLQGKPGKRARLTPNQVAAVADHVGGTLGDAFMLDLYTGLRLSELLGLRVQRIDRSRSLVPFYVIDVAEQWDETDKVYRLPKRDKTRSVPIHEEIEPLIDKHLLQYPASETTWGNMFATSTGSHYSQSNVRKVWKKALGDLDLPEVALHSIRATCVDMWIDRGLTFEQVAAMVGHSSSEITKQVYYRDLTIQDTAAALMRLDDLPTPIAMVHRDGSVTDATGRPVAL